MENKTLGQKWHEESQALGAIEGAVIGIALALAFIVFIAVGSCSRSHEMAGAQPVNETGQLTATDILIPEHVVEPPNMGIKVNEGWEKAFEPEQAVEEAVVEEEYYEEASGYGYSSGNDYGNPFKSNGTATDEYGRSYTWYSQNVLPGNGLTELNNNGRHVDDSTGYIVDGDGYIALAVPGTEMRSEENPNGYSQGDVISTPWGEGKVYDTNPNGTSWDVYTDF